MREGQSATRTILTVAIMSIIVFIASFLPAPPPSASAQPIPIGPPPCVPDSHGGCTPLIGNSDVSVVAEGVMAEGQVVTLSLIPEVPPCGDAYQSECYIRIFEPTDGCYEIPFGDLDEARQCYWWHDTEFSYALDSSGGRQTPEGRSCNAQFNYSYVQGDGEDGWAARSQRHLTCELRFAGPRPFPTLTSPTWLLMTWAIDYCLEVGEPPHGNGSECISSEQHHASAWVEVSGSYWPAVPVAECELHSSGNQVWIDDQSRVEGTNPFGSLKTEVQLPPGINDSGSFLWADSPGTYTVALTAGVRGWSDTDSTTCSTDVSFQVDDDDGSGGGVCDGLLPTVIIGDGDLPTEDDDVILGTDDPDIIDGLAGDDVICAGGGDDTVVGGAGNDRIFGEAGNDIARGNTGSDYIDGGIGDDRLLGGIDDDELIGGDGNDYLGGFGGADTISGGPGNETIFGGFGADTISGGPGKDTIRGLVGNDTIDGGAGNDILDGDRGSDIIHGGSGADLIRGGNAGDTLFGDGGNDEVSGGRADDALSGGFGTDVCIGNLELVADTADDSCETVFGVP